MNDFKFIVSSKVLLDNIETVGQVVMDNRIVPILENVLFDLTNGLLTLRASDLKTTVIQTLPVDGPPDDAGSVALPYKRLRDLLKALPEQPITIAIKAETFGAKLSADSGTYEISGENAINFPTLPPISGSGATVMVNGTVLAEAISQVVSCCASDEILKPAMAGMCWDFSPNGHVFVATDGHCLARLFQPYAEGEPAPTWGDGTAIKIIVPHKPLQMIYSLLPVNELVTVELSASQLRLTTGTTTVYARLTDERYPDYDNAIPHLNPILVTVGRKELQLALGRVLILSNKFTGSVALDFNDNLTIECEDLNYNTSAREWLLCNHEGKPIRIGFDGRILIKLLKILSAPHIKTVTIAMSRPDRAAIIRAVEKPTGGADLLLLQMPILLNTFG